MPSGRTSKYSAEIAAEICRQVANGSNLSKICIQAEMPCRDTVYKWFSDVPSFSDDYARARDCRADARSEDIDADVDELHTVQHQIASGEIDGKAGNAIVSAIRARIDTRKWQAGKEAPKRYGERLELAGDKEAPLTITVKRLDK